MVQLGGVPAAWAAIGLIVVRNHFPRHIASELPCFELPCFELPC